MQRQQTLLKCKQGSTGHIAQNMLTIREDLVNHQTYSDTPRQTHRKSTTQQLLMCSSGCMQLTLMSAVWFAGCISFLSSSVKALSLSPPCLSSVSFCWLVLDHEEPKGLGSSCWTSLGTSILLCVSLEKKQNWIWQMGVLNYILFAWKQTAEIWWFSWHYSSFVNKDLHFCTHIVSQCKHLGNKFYKHPDWWPYFL